MPRRRVIPRESQAHVRRRAQYLCEYCHTAEQWQYVPFTVDHVLPLAEGGTDALDNLALACFHCNRRKASRLTAIDPITGEVAPLFNPRRHLWSDHFIWSADGLYIIGLTAIGQATLAALGINRERVINIRAADVTVGRHPPSDDPRQTTTGTS
jgi:HNH endonuclease